jgi:hypothetical protein
MQRTSLRSASRNRNIELLHHCFNGSVDVVGLVEWDHDTHQRFTRDELPDAITGHHDEAMCRWLCTPGSLPTVVWWRTWLSRYSHGWLRCSSLSTDSLRDQACSHCAAIFSYARLVDHRDPCNYRLCLLTGWSIFTIFGLWSWLSGFETQTKRDQ